MVVAIVENVHGVVVFFVFAGVFFPMPGNEVPADIA